jgi:RNA polymerase sigma-70 factor (ECF subfamily)
MDKISFEQLVDSHYEPLFRFALSLAQRESDAGDLVQETFLRWAQKGGQLRDKSKAKSWLFTTLHRQFLGQRRHTDKFPKVEISGVEGAPELTTDTPRNAELDGATVLAALRGVDEIYRAPLALHYLEDHSYREIAEILDVPTGTVMSRISRGKELLRKLILEKPTR